MGDKRFFSFLSLFLFSLFSFLSLHFEFLTIFSLFFLSLSPSTLFSLLSLFLSHLFSLSHHLQFQPQLKKGYETVSVLLMEIFTAIIKALRDGATAGVDLTGGYYDPGDNVKFGFGCSGVGFVSLVVEVYR